MTLFTALLFAQTVVIPSPLVFAPAPVPEVREEPMVVTVLGSGTPVPSRTQAGAAVLVEVAGQQLLFDCGRACSTRLAQVDPALLTQVDRLFLTHLHSDHVSGIPDLWLNGWTQGRARPMEVWGPDGTAGLFAGLAQAFATDIGLRKADGVPATTAGLATNTHPLPAGAGVVFDEGGVRVTAFRVDHADVPAWGYRVDHAGRSVVLSGDTTATPALDRAAAGADLLLVEVLSPAMAGYLERQFTPAQVAKVKRLHLTVDQATALMRAARPTLAAYTHMVSNCAADAALLFQTAQGYNGRVTVAFDLARYEIDAGGVRATGTPPACP